MTRPQAGLSAVLALALAFPAAAPAAAQAPGRTATPWTVPRTPDGKPDLQGNWTNGTITPIERPPGVGPVLTPAQVARLEKIRADTIEALSRPSDPDRPAPPVGGDGSVGAAGGTGGYNYVWIEAGDRIAIVNGEPRSSLVVDPPDGRIPALTAAARQRLTEAAQQGRRFGAYDNPENRPLAERCIMSFGSNAGPPMLPNYFYNNNYTLVQTRDHVMILTEMVHDVRIIRLGDVQPLPKGMRPWMGDSRGRWAGDTLVVETTNFHPMQTFRGASEHLTVTERFTRVDDRTILYRFTVDDPTTFIQPWSGEVPFVAMDELIYEYACHEGNYALANVLSGARAQERDAARQPQRR
jgi:hypothetical protein